MKNLILLLLVSMLCLAGSLPANAAAKLATGDVPSALLSATSGVLPQLGTRKNPSLRERIIHRIFTKKLKKATLANDERKTDGLAIAGFVLGFVSLFVAGIPLGALSVVFSVIALERIKKNPDKRSGKGLAIAGLVLGIIGFLGGVIFALIRLSEMA